MSFNALSDSIKSLNFQILRSLVTGSLRYESGVGETCCVLVPHALDYLSRVAQVSIVPGYGLNDREVDIRYPAEAKGLFL
jgi:hypothetical protein